MSVPLFNHFSVANLIIKKMHIPCNKKIKRKLLFCLGFLSNLLPQDHHYHHSHPSPSTTVVHAHHQIICRPPHHFVHRPPIPPPKTRFGLSLSLSSITIHSAIVRLFSLHHLSTKTQISFNSHLRRHLLSLCLTQPHHHPPAPMLLEFFQI